MSGRAVVRLPWSDLTCCMVLFSRPPAGGAGGSELSGRARPGALAEGRERTGASGGRVGERKISPARFNCPKVAR